MKMQVDFVFLIDGSHTMASCMEALKGCLHQLVEELGAVQGEGLDWRGRVIVYRDETADGHRWLEEAPFVTDPSALSTQIDAVSCKGGDEATSLLDAMLHLCHMPDSARGESSPEAWRARSSAKRRVVVITASNYRATMTHPRGIADDGIGGTLDDVVHSLAATRLEPFFVAPDEDCYEAMADRVFIGGDWLEIAGPDFAQGLADLLCDEGHLAATIVRFLSWSPFEWEEPMSVTDRGVRLAPLQASRVGSQVLDEDHSNGGNMGGVCDFIFLIDGTGSMDPCMGALKANLNVFLDTLTGGQTPVRDWRGKVVVYRDEKVDGTRWLEDNPFVANDAAALKAQVDSLTAEGGGDEPESLLDALHTILHMPESSAGDQSPSPDGWRPKGLASRVVIVFTDATCRPTLSIPEGAGGTTDDVVNLLMGTKLYLFLFAPDHECYEPLAAVPYCEWTSIPGPDFVRGLEDFTRDQANFVKVLQVLAKSVSQSEPTVVL